MISSDIDRKIAVIFATDVVAYSKHMEKDEDATLASLNDCNKIIEPLIKKQKGRIFNTGGDSVFAEFPSAVAAVNAAVEFQKQIKARNDKDTTDVKLEYRIGINMGDVVKQGDANLMGDGVNVAARLEALAQPGGITISKNVYDLVANKTKYEFNDLGIQKVKQNQFHAYDLLLDPSQRRKLKTQSSNTKLIAMIGGAIAAVFIGLFFSGVFNAKQEINVQNLENSIPENPSIIVMPFENISNNSGYKYLSKSIVENIISVINGSPQLVVLSSETSLNQINQNLNIQEIAEKNNVRYVLTGSYQVLGKKIRITSQLNDAFEKNIIWSGKFDNEIDNMFEILDDISGTIFKEAHVKVSGLPRSELSYFVSNKDYMTYLKCHDLYAQFSPKTNMESFKCLKEISDYKTNPYVSMVKGWLHFQNIWMGTSKDPDIDMKLARDIAKKSKKSLTNGMPYILAGWLDFLSKDFANTEKNAKKALEIDPFNSKIIPVAGSLLRRLGQYSDALPVFTKTLELSSNPAHWVWFEYAITLTALKKYKKANELIEKALTTKEAGTQNTILILNQAAIAIYENNIEIAKEKCKKAKFRTPNFDLEKNLKMISDTVDKDFYKNFLSAVKSACGSS